VTHCSKHRVRPIGFYNTCWCDPLFFTTPPILSNPGRLNGSNGREFNLGFRNSVFWFPGMIKWKRPEPWDMSPSESRRKESGTESWDTLSFLGAYDSCRVTLIAVDSQGQMEGYTAIGSSTARTSLNFFFVLDQADMLHTHRNRYRHTHQYTPTQPHTHTHTCTQTLIARQPTT